MSQRTTGTMKKFTNFLKQKSAAQAEDYYKDRTKKSLMGRIDNYLGRTPGPPPTPRPSHMQAIIDRAESELDMEERALAHGGETWRSEQIELNKKAELAVQKIKQQKEARPYGNGNQEWLKAYETELLIVAWVDLLKVERLWTQTAPLRWPCLAETGFLRTGMRTEPSKLAYNTTVVLDGRQDFRASRTRRLMQGALPSGNNVDMYQHTVLGKSGQSAGYGTGGVAPVQEQHQQRHSFRSGQPSAHTEAIAPVQQQQRHSFYKGSAGSYEQFDTRAAQAFSSGPTSQQQGYQQYAVSPQPNSAAQQGFI